MSIVVNRRLNFLYKAFIIVDGVVGAGLERNGWLSHLVVVAARGIQGLEAYGTHSAAPRGHCHFRLLQAIVHYVLATLSARLRVWEEIMRCRRVCQHLRRQGWWYYIWWHLADVHIGFLLPPQTILFFAIFHSDCFAKLPLHLLRLLQSLQARTETIANVSFFLRGRPRGF